VVELHNVIYAAISTFVEKGFQALHWQVYQRASRWEAIYYCDTSKDEEEEEQDHIYLHGIWRLVAGAVQEWDLVQQPKACGHMYQAWQCACMAR
jgi:hypothetical protein